MTTRPRVRYTVDGRIARVVLDRPEKRNALDADTISGIGSALERAEADENVRVVTLSGEGPDFCAGADLMAVREMFDAPVLRQLDDAERLGRLFLRMRRASKPIVALVRGRALGGGCGLATACDLVLASEDARFGYTEVRLGFVPALVMAILSRNVTEKRAFELVATGEIHPAPRFEAWGIVNRTYPKDGFDEESAAFVAALAERETSALSLSKRLLYRQAELSFEAAIQSGAEVNAISRMTEETRAGVTAFFAKKGDGERGGDGDS